MYYVEYMGKCNRYPAILKIATKEEIKKRAPTIIVANLGSRLEPEYLKIVLQ